MTVFSIVPFLAVQSINKAS